MTWRARAWQILFVLAAPQDAVELKKRGLKTRIDDVAGNIWQTLALGTRCQLSNGRRARIQLSGRPLHTPPPKYFFQVAPPVILLHHGLRDPAVPQRCLDPVFGMTSP